MATKIVEVRRDMGQNALENYQIDKKDAFYCMSRRLGHKEREEIFDDFLAGNRTKFSVYLKSGGNPDLKDSYGRTLLINSTINHDIDAVRFLLKHGAKPDKKDNSNMEAIDYATLSGNELIAKELHTALNLEKDAKKSTGRSVC